MSIRSYENNLYHFLSSCSSCITFSSVALVIALVVVVSGEAVVVVVSV